MKLGFNTAVRHHRHPGPGPRTAGEGHHRPQGRLRGNPRVREGAPEVREEGDSPVQVPQGGRVRPDPAQIRQRKDHAQVHQGEGPETVKPRGRDLRPPFFYRTVFGRSCINPLLSDIYPEYLWADDMR